MTSLTATVLEETTQIIETTAVNVAADISKVALIFQRSKNTKEDASKQKAYYL